MTEENNEKLIPYINSDMFSEIMNSTTTYATIFAKEMMQKYRGTQSALDFEVSRINDEIREHAIQERFPYYFKLALDSKDGREFEVLLGLEILEP